MLDFEKIARILQPAGRLLVVEPPFHVSKSARIAGRPPAGLTIRCAGGRVLSVAGQPKQGQVRGTKSELLGPADTGSKKVDAMKLEKATTGLSPHVCNGCGECCRNFAFVRLSQDDIKALESFTGLTSEEFTNNIDKAGKKRFMKFKENGDCIFLNRIDGAYSCSAYEARSVTCRGYPSTDIQRETCRVKSGRRS